MLCDLVAAKDPNQVAQSSNPSKELGGIDIKGIETVKLEKLFKQLVGKEPAESDFDMVASAGDDGPWVVPIPAALTSALAKLDADGLKAAAARWAKIEEFAKDGWKPAAVAKALKAMSALAVEAQKKKLTLFLWMSL